MWFSAALLASLLGVVVCRPPIVTPHGNFSTEPISEEDRQWLMRHVPTHRASYPPGFKYLYISQDGHVAPNQRPEGNFLKIVGSPRTSEKTMYVAALTLHKMMKHSPPRIFNSVASSTGGLGIFTAAEKLTVFPQYASFADVPACRGICGGYCSQTCTGDGRKLEDLAGLTASLAVVLDDNVICSDSDPYQHGDNIVVHEFTHMIGFTGLNSTEKKQNDNNYMNARYSGLWNPRTYAMANPAEYLAEAAGAFFLVNRQSGGMTDCSYGQCRTEMDARNVLRSRDVNLYNFLVHMFTDGRADLPSGLRICY